MLERSIEHFQRAIEKEPNYGLAHAGLASTYHWLASSGFPEYFPKAKAASLKALEIDDTIAEAHGSLAFTLRQFEWDWSGAEKHYQRAIELNPSLGGDGQFGYALLLSAAGRHGEAMAMIKRAEQLDPLVLPLKAHVGFIYLMARQYERAIEQLRRVVELDPNTPVWHAALGRAYVFSGRHEEGIREFHKALELSGITPPYKAELAWGLAMVGRRVEAEELVGELIERPPRRASYVARVYAALGDADRAFTWLEEALEQRDFIATFLGVNPDFDNLRSDPRFQDLLRRINYPK